MSEPDHQISSRVRVDSAGRIVIPADLRNTLGIEPGQDLILSGDANGVQIMTFGTETGTQLVCPDRDRDEPKQPIAVNTDRVPVSRPIVDVVLALLESRHALICDGERSVHPYFDNSVLAPAEPDVIDHVVPPAELNADKV